MPIDPSDLGPHELAGLIERLILEQQGLEPVELLLAAGVLAYPDYEAWRLGHRAALQTALRLPLTETLALLRQGEQLARAAGLTPAAVDYRRWGDHPVPIRVGPSAALNRALATRYVPPAHRRQLDLFYDSGTVALGRTLQEAVLARRFGDARAACGKLRERDPAHARLGDWLRLIDTLERSSRMPGPGPSRPDAPARLRDIDAITPVAERLLGHGARDCLAPLWAGLASAADGLRFDPGEPRLHASFALARLGRWPEVRAAIEAEPRWRDEPQLMERHARACRRSGDARAALADWLALCWVHPDTAERVLGAGDFPDARLAARWGAFCDLDPPDDAARALATGDFPAWCLLVEPSLAPDAPPDPAVADPDRVAAYRAALALASAPDDLDQRRALGAAHPALLAVFLALRRGP
jgi:hypothetical protein